MRGQIKFYQRILDKARSQKNQPVKCKRNKAVILAWCYRVRAASGIGAIV